jgi:hypothetical protein
MPIDQLSITFDRARDCFSFRKATNIDTVNVFCLRVILLIDTQAYSKGLYLS